MLWQNANVMPKKNKRKGYASSNGSSAGIKLGEMKDKERKVLLFTEASATISYVTSWVRKLGN